LDLKALTTMAGWFRIQWDETCYADNASPFAADQEIFDRSTLLK